MIAPPEPLSLRKTVIGGETAPDDFEVIWDGLSIGRIRRQAAAVGAANWSWGLILAHMSQHDWMRGSGGDLEECKSRFRQAWSAVHDRLTETDVRQLREDEQASLERPWKKKR